MPDQYLSTLTPQVGDATQMLLSRMAQSLANAFQARTATAWLPSANYSSTQALTLTVPSGARGIVFRILTTAVPGVDTIQMGLADGTAGRGYVTGGASATLENHLMIVHRCAVTTVPSGTNGTTAGLTETITLRVTHSGAGTFTYRTEYCWLY